MATLSALKHALKEEASSKAATFSKQPLSDLEYSVGFDTISQGPGWLTYQDFIFPQLAQVLDTISGSRPHFSVLEIGPGRESVLEHLPFDLRRKIKRYSAFEPNGLYASQLRERLNGYAEAGRPMPCLDEPAEIQPVPFAVTSKIAERGEDNEIEQETRFDVVLFCQSMYGMEPKRKFIEQALHRVAKSPQEGLLVVFHRDGVLDVGGLVCRRTVSYPDGVVGVADDDQVLDRFASFVVGYAAPENEDTKQPIRGEWRQVCRTLARREKDHPGQLLFSSPDLMMIFTHNATVLPQLTARVPLATGHSTVKNREACLQHPASIVRPTEIQHVQQCVRWALEHGFAFTVLGGGHSGHCLRSATVSIDMSAFSKVSVVPAKDGDGSNTLIVAGAGCKTGDIIRSGLLAGVTVPLGSRPSVGAGLWLQGGIGHLSRLHGLACDSIIGAVIISVCSSQILCVGLVPKQHQPPGAVRPDNEVDLLWALRGAGTSFGIVISVTFRAFQAPTTTFGNWVLPLSDKPSAQATLANYDMSAKKLPRDSPADAYLFWDHGQMRLGLTRFHFSLAGTTGIGATSSSCISFDRYLGPEDALVRRRSVDCAGLFDAEMYMNEMHGGHGGGRTSAFKRCIFLKSVMDYNVGKIIVDALEARPSPFCYFHILQGGGAIRDSVADATAFGCRDWEFACVITGVWPRGEDGTKTAESVVSWVYATASDLLPWSTGVYGADLGPDPRDDILAAKAFGPNNQRLAHLKRILDPQNILAYACPFPTLTRESKKQKLILLVTGDHGAGKDFCAGIWASVLSAAREPKLSVRIASISDTTKRDYAKSTGADVNRLLLDRVYKEQHRSELTKFFKEQVQQRPRLAEEHFLSIVSSAQDEDVLFITGMRDEAPVARFSHLTPKNRLFEIRVTAGHKTRQARRGYADSHDDIPNPVVTNHRPNLEFQNDTKGKDAAIRFAKDHLLRLVSGDLQKLENMIRAVPGFPRHGIEFRHVLDIAQHVGGLDLCASLLQRQFIGDWAKVDVVACCEAGGFVFASALACRVGLRLALIRAGGKLPPPKISVTKSSSHISAREAKDPRENEIEIGCHVIPEDGRVVVVDDVLASGETLCAVLRLLQKSGADTDHVSVMVVVEFPVHRGRELLRQRGFGKVNIQSLLSFGNT